jgi:hypothetical protein
MQPFPDSTVEETIYAQFDDLNEIYGGEIEFRATSQLRGLNLLDELERQWANSTKTDSDADFIDRHLNFLYRNAYIHESRNLKTGNLTQWYPGGYHD